jgi:hypothetical protein
VVSFGLSLLLLLEHLLYDLLFLNEEGAHNPDRYWNKQEVTEPSESQYNSLMSL